MSSVVQDRPAAAALAGTAPDAQIVRVEALHKHFGGPKVLEDVSFTLSRGRVHSLIGPNGAGRTTLLNIASALCRDSSGRVLVDGHDLATLAPHQLAPSGVSRTFQNLKICRGMTVLENVLLGAHVGPQGGPWAGIFRPPSLARRDRELTERARMLLALVGAGDAAPSTTTSSRSTSSATASRTSRWTSITRLRPARGNSPN